jgi:hypothetical protein
LIYDRHRYRNLLRAVNKVRNLATLRDEGNRSIEVFATCGKPRLPFNLEIIPSLGLAKNAKVGSSILRVSEMGTG